MRPVFSLVTAPASEPITLAEAAAQVRQDSNADNDYLTRLIEVVRRAYEEECGLYFITQTVDMHLPCWPSYDFIRIPRGPLQSVTSLKYVTSDNTEETFAAADYDLDARRNQIVLGFGKTWPSATLRPMDPITVRMVVGYGSALAVPAQAKHALLMELDHLYSHRSNVTLGSIAIESRLMARASQQLMASLRNWSF